MSSGQFLLDDSDSVFVEPDNDKKLFYTCRKKSCMIPCPCKLCTTDARQCSNHHIKHIELFNETQDLISVRSTEQSCTKENFFRYSYVLKYPGIPKTCSSCVNDLLHHKSYHLKFHWSCKFCKLYQYKLYPKSLKQLQERELQEKAWYKLVCPHCDKKLSGQKEEAKFCHSVEHEAISEVKYFKLHNCYSLAYKVQIKKL